MDKNSLEEVVIGVQTGVTTLIGTLCILASFVGIFLGLALWILQFFVTNGTFIPFIAGAILIFVSYGLNHLGIMFCKSATHWIN